MNGMVFGPTLPAFQLASTRPIPTRRVLHPIPTRRVSEGPPYVVSATFVISPSLTRRVVKAKHESSTRVETSINSVLTDTPGPS